MTRRVVLIEDDPAIAALMQEILVELGHAVDSRSELTDGVVDGEPLLVITDLVALGRYDGDAARAWIARVRAAYPSARVIVATAHAPARLAGNALGADAVLIKPFEVAAFTATVESMLA